MKVQIDHMQVGHVIAGFLQNGMRRAQVLSFSREIRFDIYSKVERDY